MSAWKARTAFALIFAVFGSLGSLVVLYILGVLLVALFLLLDRALYVFSNYTKSFLALVDLNLLSGVLGALFVGIFLVVLVISIIYGYRLGGKIVVAKDFAEGEQNVILSSALFLTFTFLILGFGLVNAKVLPRETKCWKISDKSIIFSSRLLKIFDYPVDIENDGFDDYLNLAFLIATTCEGDYKIQASFYDKDGTLIKKIFEKRYLREGEGQISTLIPREQLPNVIKKGGFVLKEIILKGQYYNEELKRAGELVIEKKDHYTLESYSSPEARTGWITFEGVRDYGVDADGNGLFEEFLVEIEASVFSEGTYQAQIILERGLSSERRVFELKNGQQKIEFIIPGADIFDRKIDGPFRVKSIVFQLEQESGVGILDERSINLLESYVTKEYNHTQFE